MEVSVLFYLGGIYHIGWAIFDLFWPRFFNWKTTLAHLDDFNRAVLYISGRLLVLLYLYIAWVSFYYGSDLLMTGLGITIPIFVVIYWAFRAIMQIQFFGFRKANTLNVKVSDGNFPPPINRMSNQSLSTIIFGIMIIGILLYLLPVLFSL
jgi:hypothetical protein